MDGNVFWIKKRSSKFPKKIDKILFEYSNFIIIYIDDILICFENENDHEKHLNIFITLCKTNGVILSYKNVNIKKKKYNFKK